MADLDVDELIRMRRQSHQFAVFDPLLGDVVSIPIPLREDAGDTLEPSGPREPPTNSTVPSGNDDDLRRYISLRETLRAVQHEIKELEPRILARAAAFPNGGTLFTTAGRTLITRPRQFPLWKDVDRRDDLLRELGWWDSVSAYNWSKFNSLYQKEAGLRNALGNEVRSEQRFTLLVQTER